MSGLTKFAGVGNLLTPENSALLLIDHQPQMFFGVQSADRQTIVNNVVGLSKAAKVFKVPVILSTIAAESFSGPIIREIQEVFPGITPIDRTSMNAWEDKKFVEAVKKTGRKKLVMAALWTEVCLAFPALSALGDGYEVYAVVDASGGSSQAAHDSAVSRLVQSGAIPMTWLQVLLEYQRDWARTGTYDAVIDIIKEHAGAYGQGVFYATSMLGGHAEEARDTRKGKKAA